MLEMANGGMDFNGLNMDFTDEGFDEPVEFGFYTNRHR